jgi:hypothetical protein
VSVRLDPISSNRPPANPAIFGSQTIADRRDASSRAASSIIERVRNIRSLLLLYLFSYIRLRQGGQPHLLPLGRLGSGVIRSRPPVSIAYVTAAHFRSEPPSLFPSRSSTAVPSPNRVLSSNLDTDRLQSRGWETTAQKSRALARPGSDRSAIPWRLYRTNRRKDQAGEIELVGEI